MRNPSSRRYWPLLFLIENKSINEWEKKVDAGKHSKILPQQFVDTATPPADRKRNHGMSVVIQMGTMCYNSTAPNGYLHGGSIKSSTHRYKHLERRNRFRGEIANSDAGTNPERTETCKWKGGHFYTAKLLHEQRWTFKKSGKIRPQPNLIILVFGQTGYRFYWPSQRYSTRPI